MICPIRNCNALYRQYDLQLIYSEKRDFIEKTNEIFTRNSLEGNCFVDCINCGEMYEDDGRSKRVTCVLYYY